MHSRQQLASLLAFAVLAAAPLLHSAAQSSAAAGISTAAQSAPTAQAPVDAAPGTMAENTPTVTTTATSANASGQAAAPPAYMKKDKNPYTGPSEIIELPPTPMLDEEGKQRLDPDGKPMFNAPVRQQRDKHGHPLFDEAGKPVFQTAKERGYDRDGHKLHADKEKAPKTLPMTISRGVFTVDGLTGKAALNYDIADLKYIYMWAPGIGVAVVSNEPFPGGKEEKGAFDDRTLTVTVGEHTLQLASDQRLLKEKHPVSAFVLLDRDTIIPSSFPAVGYGDTRRSPYLWPGSHAQVQLKEATLAPPPPRNLMPTQLLKPCPAGQMRRPAPRTLPGQPQQDQPCVNIAQAQTAADVAK